MGGCHPSWCDENTPWTWSPTSPPEGANWLRAQWASPLSYRYPSQYANALIHFIHAVCLSMCRTSQL